MHFFKVYGTSVSDALQRVKQDLMDHHPQEWSNYLLLGTLDIGADEFYYSVPNAGRYNIITNLEDINKELTKYVSAENFNKKKEFLFDFIMCGDWTTAERACRDLAGIEYAMGRKIDVADLNVPVINGENVVEPGLSKVGIGPGLASRETAYLVEVEFFA